MPELKIDDALRRKIVSLFRVHGRTPKEIVSILREEDGFKVCHQTVRARLERWRVWDPAIYRAARRRITSEASRRIWRDPDIRSRISSSIREAYRKKRERREELERAALREGNGDLGNHGDLGEVLPDSTEYNSLPED